jgi:hypothetical protein
MQSTLLVSLHICGLSRLLVRGLMQQQNLPDVLFQA